MNYQIIYIGNIINFILYYNDPNYIVHNKEKISQIK